MEFGQLYGGKITDLLPNISTSKITYVGGGR